MNSFAKVTEELKEKIRNYYNVSEKKDEEILMFLCFASNTLSTVEHAFEKAKACSASLVGFYEIVVGDFLAQDMFPMCVERIVSAYPYVYNRALEFALKPNRVFMSIWNNNEVPCIDAGIVKLPFFYNWGKTLNFGYVSKKEHNYSIEQLLSKLSCSQYEFTGPVKLITGNEIRVLKPGYYTFYVGKDWLVAECDW